MQRNIKKIPVVNIISFDKSAQNELKKIPVKIPLNISNPPIANRRPNNTTICIIIFFLEVKIIAKIEKRKIGTPIIEGIKEVKDEFDVTKLTNKPHNIRNKPYKIEIDSILSPANLYSFLGMFII